MFHDKIKQRALVWFAFMLERDFAEDLKQNDQSDILINLANIISESVNFQRAELVILCKSTQKLKLAKQVSKHAHWQSNTNKVYYYVIFSRIDFERIVTEKCKKKIDFSANIFQTVKNETVMSENANSMNSDDRKNETLIQNVIWAAAWRLFLDM